MGLPCSDINTLYLPLTLHLCRRGEGEYDLDFG